MVHIGPRQWCIIRFSELICMWRIYFVCPSFKIALCSCFDFILSICLYLCVVFISTFIYFVVCACVCVCFFMLLPHFVHDASSLRKNDFQLNKYSTLKSFVGFFSLSPVFLCWNEISQLLPDRFKYFWSLLTDWLQIRWHFILTPIWNGEKNMKNAKHMAKKNRL